MRWDRSYWSSSRDWSGLLFQDEDEDGEVVVWAPQPGPQHAFIQCPFFDVLFGGARGGGKSDGCLGEFASHAKEYGSYARGVFMRREMPQADSLIDRSHEIYGPLGWSYAKVDRQWTSPEGAVLRFRPLEDDRDAEKYQGQQFTRVYLEELTNWPTSRAPDKMKATLRSAAGVRCAFRATANPGGVGHHWVKARYIDPAPAGNVPLLDEAGEYERIYIPARVSDNVILMQNDPGYARRLYLVGSPELVRRWLEGDWSVIEGAFFENWDDARHVIRPFSIPDGVNGWLRFRSMDWGSAKPFSIGWYAVVTDDFAIPDRGLVLPRGCLVKYREWYGAKAPNVGLKLTAEQVAAGIREREALDSIKYGVADPSIFSEDGGPSIAERMAMPVKENDRVIALGLRWQPADNTRIGKLGAIAGWDLVRHRLDGEAEDRPMLVFFNVCADSIRTIPALQHDKRRIEDVDTTAEDHCFVGSTLVDMKCGSVPIEDLCEPTRRDTLVVNLSFDDGRVVTCTPDHKFMTKRGWVEAQDLLGEFVLSLPVAKNSRANAITSVVDIFSTKANGFTVRCGNFIADQYRQIVTFIIGSGATEIRSKIYNVCYDRNILPVTVKSTSIVCENNNQQRVSLLNSGTSRRKDAFGTNSNTSKLRTVCLSELGIGALLVKRRLSLSNMLSSVRMLVRRLFDVNPASMMSSESVNSAAEHSRQTAISALVSAATSAARVVSVSPAGKADVYCLAVPDVGAFTIEGGLLVHNCGDETRYACGSRPWVKKSIELEKPLVGMAGVTMKKLWKQRSNSGTRV